MLKKLLLYFISNSFNKLVLLFLLPLFTALLAPEELGEFEIVNTLSLILNVAITIQIHEGVLKLLLKSDEDKESILSSAFLIMFCSLVVFNLINMIISLVIPIKGFEIMVLFFNTQILVFFMQRITRGLQHHVLFTIGNIVNWGLIGALLPLYLIYKGATAVNMYSAFTTSNFITIIFFIVSQKEFRSLTYNSINREKIKYLLKYSGPLVLDAISLWMINFADRIFLGILASVAAVGIYGVANKFAATLMFFNTIFYLGWQEYALSVHNPKEREELFTKIFNRFFTAILSVFFILLPLCKYLMYLVIDEEYHEAVLYIPLLMSSVVFTSFASFFSLKYQVSGKTAQNFYTSLTGNIVNVVLNLILIPLYGIMGAAIATIFAFLTLWVIRIPKSEGFINLSELKTGRFIGLLLFGGIIVYSYYSLEGIYLPVISGIMIVFFFLLNRELLSELLDKFIKKAAH